MAYRFRLIDAKTQDAAIMEIAAVCPDSTKFIALINQAQRRLMKRGNWAGTEVLVHFCVYDRCITLPRYVETVLGGRMCQGYSVTPQNFWYSILGDSGGCMGFDSQVVLADVGFAPIYRKMSGGTGRLIRYYVTKRPDIGKTITIYGTDGNGLPLQTRDSDGNWTDGITITAAAPFASTSVLVRSITSVVREATQGQARLYEYDADTDLLRDIALYEPNETNPQYRQMKLNSDACLSVCTDDDGREIAKAEFLVKLAYIPVATDADFLFIDDFDALKLAVQAIRAEEANDDALAEAKWIKAIRELNMDIRNKYPEEQTVVRVQAMLGASAWSPI